MAVKDFAESAKGFTKSPLGIIALFIVLVYGFASVVVGFSSKLTDQSVILPLIYFLVLFPVIVFVGFLWLVAKHHNKLYGPSDFRNDDNFIKAQMASVASLAAASAKGSSAESGVDTQNIGEIVETVTRSRGIARDQGWKNKVLWVDDRPENNVYERQALEAQGIAFSLALSTNEAMQQMRTNKFAAVISDMGRKEGPMEGYKLLEEMQSAGIGSPFIIYAGSNLPEHKKLARQKGAIGSTNRANELFDLVMNAVTSAR
jgi:CheY-like chemotaxis protein